MGAAGIRTHSPGILALWAEFSAGPTFVPRVTHFADPRLFILASGLFHCRDSSIGWCPLLKKHFHTRTTSCFSPNVPKASKLHPGTPPPFSFLKARIFHILSSGEVHGGQVEYLALLWFKGRISFRLGTTPTEAKLP